MALLSIGVMVMCLSDNSVVGLPGNESFLKMVAVSFY